MIYLALAVWSGLIRSLPIVTPISASVTIDHAEVVVEAKNRSKYPLAVVLHATNFKTYRLTGSMKVPVRHTSDTLMGGLSDTVIIEPFSNKTFTLSFYKHLFIDKGTYEITYLGGIPAEKYDFPNCAWIMQGSYTHERRQISLSKSFKVTLQIQ